MNEQLRQLIPILIPIVVIALALAVAALLDLRKQTSIRGSKWMWALIICFFSTSFLGPLAYFTIGRKEQ